MFNLIKIFLLLTITAESWASYNESCAKETQSVISQHVFDLSLCDDQEKQDNQCYSHYYNLLVNENENNYENINQLLEYYCSEKDVLFSDSDCFSDYYDFIDEESNNYYEQCVLSTNNS